MGLKNFIQKKSREYQVKRSEQKAFNQKLKERERQGFEDSALLAAERKGRMRGREYGSGGNSFSAKLGGSLDALSVGVNHASNTLFSGPQMTASNLDVFQNPQAFGMPVERSRRMQSKRRMQQKQGSPYDWMNDF